MTSPLHLAPEASGAPVVLLDLDGVLLDLHSRLRAEVARLAGERGFEHRFPDPIRDWRITTDCARTSRAIRDAFRVPGVFAGLEPLPGAVRAVRELQDEVQVVFCSSPFASNPTCLQDKFDNVRNLFGRTAAESLILTRDKTLVHGAILIDDRPRIVGRNPDPAWEHMLFRAPYNEHLRPRLVLDGWGDGAVEAVVAAANCARRPPSGAGRA